MKYELLGYHSANLRVRFGQTDRYGHTWHGHLPTFLEEGRASFARHYGLGTDTLLGHNVAIPMIELACEYCHASYEDELLDVQLTLLRPVLKLPGFVFLYRIFGGPEGRTEIARGRTRQVVAGREGGLLLRSPKAISELVEATWRDLETAPRWQDPRAIISSSVVMGDEIVPFQPTPITPTTEHAYEQRS